ncbi:MAG: hypothetical protein IPQ08_07640 [Chitinophagaceae bacterium]|nr:hypothetical protein [Chitinophagaceae bacterium]
MIHFSKWLMKTFLLFCLGILLISDAIAQPLTGADYLSKPARVVSWQVNVEGLTTVSAVNSSSDNVVKTYRYMDGFGRPLQDIIEGLHRRVRI